MLSQLVFTMRGAPACVNTRGVDDPGKGTDVDKLCTIEGCTRPLRARGWCMTHYQQWKRRGAPVPPTAVERFWARVEKTEQCWLWRGSLTVYGYGQVRMDGVYSRAHRVAYELLVGPIPDDRMLDHLCSVRHCVNPEHLEPVTCRENLMRSPITLAAQNAAKTVCAQGHPLSGENVYLRGTRRACRTCMRVNYRATG